MPPSNYSQDKLAKTKMEKFVPTPIIVDYLLRKILLGLMCFNIYVLSQVSKVYGFNYSAEVSDRESWNWKVKEKIPGVHAEARIER